MSSRLWFGSVFTFVLAVSVVIAIALTTGCESSENGTVVTEEKVEEMLQVFHDIFRNLSKLNQVTIAATKGFALGGGCEVALYCDMIFAANNLKIGQPEIKLSAIPPIALLIMPYLIGLKKASELLFTGKIINAEEADYLTIYPKLYGRLLTFTYESYGV